ncbi:MAG: DUF3822 family protein [Bacteroidales bacterium]|jgi:hypothetical protein
MPFLELFDETLDINSTVNYELTVQASSDGFAFVLLDTIRNKYVLLRSAEPEENKYFTSADISDFIGRDDFLLKKYKEVNLVIPSSKFTLVPSPLFDPGRKEEYFTFNLIRAENEEILFNKIANPDAYSVFSVPGAILDSVRKFYPSVYPLHHTKPLLSQLSHQSRSLAGNYVHVHVEREFFNLFLFEHGNLDFSNTFSYRNISDILYYVLNTFKSRGLSHDETIYFSGQTEKFDDLYSNLALYIKNLKFTGPSGNFTFSYVFNEVGLHRFINLFGAASCE